MDTTKCLEFFSPTMATKEYNIIGVGAIGSHVLECLVRLGIPKIHIWDMDVVESHNIANQMFRDSDIGVSKVDAMERYAKEINPDIVIVKHDNGLQPPYVVNGYVFMCVDNIDLRREIVMANKMNPNCEFIQDYRMRLTDAQAYMAVRSKTGAMDFLLSTMQFSHAEAKDATPKSACGTELGVIFTVKAIVSFGIANFVNYILNGTYKKTMLIDTSVMEIEAYDAK